MTRSARLVDDAGNTLLTLDSDTADGSVVLNTIDLGYPTVREATSSLSGQDGELDLTQFTGGRAITAELALMPSPTVGTLVDTIRGLMHPGRRMWLLVQMDGWSAERQIQVRGASLAAPTGPLPWVVQLGWKAPGPTFEDITLSSVTLNPAGSSGGGMSLPMSFPTSFAPGLVPGASLLTVAGNVNASPVIDIYGPCSGPLFRVVDTGRQLSFPALDVAAGDYLHIDVAARSVTLNNDPNQSRYASLDFAVSSWPTLPPGSPQVVFSPASESPGCVAVVSWRSQWA